MLDLGSRSNKGVPQSHQAIDAEGWADDWDLIVRETRHRMKNILTLLGASMRLDLLRSGAQHVEPDIDQFERRIVAFGRLCQLLSDCDGVREISVLQFFERLSAALSEAILEPAGIRCEASIEEGMLSAKQYHRLGLIVSELVTNAAKHAFQDENAGLIRIEVRYRNDCWYFTVADNGIGVIGPLRGTGGRILQSLARSIRAKLHSQAGLSGTAVTIVMPVSE